MQSQLAHLAPWKCWECTFLVSHWFWKRSHEFLGCREVLRMFYYGSLGGFINVPRTEMIGYLKAIK